MRGNRANGGHTMLRTGMWGLVWLGATALAAGEGPAFRVVPLDAAAEYPACAVFDVDRDGKLDIFSGGAWFRGPDFRRHFVRDVEVIRGRFDDYSNLPWDVDGDGWLDVISVNYRSQSIYWVRNPGDTTSAWQKIVAVTPGPMETGRLIDLNRDGVLDLLPNGTDFAAWWELATGPADAAAAAHRWTRHELPTEIAGHGIGAGDINGDGRMDIVFNGGWCESAADETWTVRRDFRLHRDASVPILVHDVDGDGDQDLIWGRGHHVGLYWLEQSQTDPAQPWVQHTIDATWSQAHSLLLADVTGDGRDELIAGQRYMGHEGRDLGEYDPLHLYWFSFDSSSRAWKRGLIHRGGRVGFGLDPKAADVDGDGDIDIVAADRSGLFLCLNLTHDAAQATEPSVTAAGPTYDHRSILKSIDAEGRTTTITDPFAWGVRRAAILDGLQEAMGPLPEPLRRVPLNVQTLEETDAGRYLRRRIQFTSEPGDVVPAYLLVPKQLAVRAPAMLCLHQTTGIGKGEPAGLGGLPNLHYAHELAERGFVCLVPDYPSFGDYRFDFQAVSDRYASGSMKAIWNNMRAVDLLESLPQVDPDRLGVIGHSLGGHNALFTAAFDQRLRAVVTSCGFTAFHHYYEGKLAGWTSDRYMPRIRDRYQNDPNLVPFDFYEVLGAIAPRAVFVNAPVGDGNFAVVGVKQVEAEVEGVYKLLKSQDENRVRYVYPDCGHDFPPDVREECYQWLERVMK